MKKTKKTKKRPSGQKTTSVPNAKPARPAPAGAAKDDSANSTSQFKAGRDLLE